MTPFELVCQHYTFPFESFFPKQIETINELAPLQNSGHWLDVGVGKTAVSTVCALYHKLTAPGKYHTIVVMPPILLKQWAKWLAKIKPVLTVTRYQGTPKERSVLSLDADFILVGIQIFKKDYERFDSFFKTRYYDFIIDEATMVASIDSDQHDKCYDFSIGHPVMPLTGTPVSNPMNVYALTKFSAPGTYRNFVHFCTTHVADRDFWGNPCEYTEIELLHTNIMKNSKRVLFSDIYPDASVPMFIPIEYDLQPDHIKLYKKLAEEQLLLLPDGGKIDATSSSRLIHALGQIVVNHGHFAGDPSKVSTAVDTVKETLDELGEDKLVVFTQYRLTSDLLCKRFAKSHGAVGVWGDVPQKQKDHNVEKFINDPDCRMIVIQFASGGFGLDGLQTVCNDALFIEPCTEPKIFTQCVGRLVRTGQRKRVRVRCAIAGGTLQVRRFGLLLDNDAMVNKIIRNVDDLRTMIYGG